MNPNQLRTSAQSIKLNTLVSKLGIDKEAKADLVSQFSNGRTTTSAKLFIGECASLINLLENGKKVETHVASRILTVLEKTRWRLIYTLRDKGMVTEKGKPDMQKINHYTTHYWGKLVGDMDMHELNIYISVVKTWREKDASHKG